MKTKTIFTCQQCGYQSAKWQGKCPDCGNWNTFLEEDYRAPGSKKEELGIFDKKEAVLLKDVESIASARISTNITEVDRVLGGGIVPGSVTLLAGDPGVGKSTLCLQVAWRLSKSGHKILYVSGEESLRQVKLRAERLIDPPAWQGAGSDIDNLYLVNQTDLTQIIGTIKKILPDFVIIDSIQVISDAQVSSNCGSVTQVRECAGLLASLAKSLNIAVLIVGHVTKEGTIAGPRVLEHIVDTVLYFEGERYSIYKILRTTKNRFGSTNEIGVFEMGISGLREITNPSEVFLSQRPKDTSGSVVVSALEGLRPILAEVQALVSRCSFGFAQRRAKGIDYNRLSLLVAVLEKRIGLNLGTEDIFINVAGGIELDDPACDLGIIAAITSSFKNKIVPSDFVLLGEVGLSADVRSISFTEIRIKEAEKLGFKKCILPETNLRDKAFLRKDSGIECIGVGTIKEALDICLV